MDSIVQSIVTALSGKISKELIVFLVSMVPLLELRGSILRQDRMQIRLSKQVKLKNQTLETAA